MAQSAARTSRFHGFRYVYAFYDAFSGLDAEGAAEPVERKSRTRICKRIPPTPTRESGTTARNQSTMDAIRGERCPPRGRATQVTKELEVQREDRYRPAGAQCSPSSPVYFRASDGDIRAESTNTVV